MLEIRIKGEALDLPEDMTMDVSDSSPVFNDRGSLTFPATVPPTGRNRRLLGHIHRLDSDTPPSSLGECEVSDRSYRRQGKINVTEASRQGISFNVGFDNSTIYGRFAKMKLADIPGLPEINSSNPSLDLWADYVNADPQTSEWAVFPVAVCHEESTEGSGAAAVTKHYWEILNDPTGENPFGSGRTVTRLIDGQETTVTVPAYYGITPFLRVWAVLHYIFSAEGYEIVSNPFLEDIELSRLVILNNSADVACTGKIRYSELMPDVTVEELMKSLWARFGLVYSLDCDTMTVRLELLRDILVKKATAVDDLMCDYLSITYRQPRCLKLSAKSSLSGAAPKCERFEDFIRGHSLTTLKQGENIAAWTKLGNGFGYEGAPVDGNNTMIAREYQTGKWYLLDKETWNTREVSSPFFNWDPQTEGCETEEITSEDEWVPVSHVDGVGMLPCYLCGCRHYHSYIAGADSKTTDGKETPLAFLFAYTNSTILPAATFGSYYPEGPGGQAVSINGETCRYSLLFQFANGLFATFWRQYDEILRHGNRSVKASFMRPAGDGVLSAADILEPVTLQGVRCLTDKLEYSLPYTGKIKTDVTLFTIQTQGNYDIVAEQGIPEFGDTTIKWVEIENNLMDIADNTVTKQRVVEIWNEETGESANRAFIEMIDYSSGTWMDNPDNANVVIGQIRVQQYRALVVYGIQENRVYRGRYGYEITYTVKLQGQEVTV